MINVIASDNKSLIHTICLFIIMLSLSSFVLGNNNEQEVILMLIWICTTFVLQISTNDLFVSDYRNGILEQIFIQPYSSKLIIVCKVFTHWLLFGLPISVISSMFSFIVLGDSIKHSVAIGLSLLFNTLVIINISATGNSLMIGKSNLTSGISQILILPIIMPSFIYFKLLTKYEDLVTNTLLITILIFIVLIVSSIIATNTALRFAVEQD